MCGSSKFRNTFCANGARDAQRKRGRERTGEMGRILVSFLLHFFVLHFWMEMSVEWESSVLLIVERLCATSATICVQCTYHHH